LAVFGGAIDFAGRLEDCADGRPYLGNRSALDGDRKAMSIRYLVENLEEVFFCIGNDMLALVTPTLATKTSASRGWGTQNSVDYARRGRNLRCCSLYCSIWPVRMS
jgi:hypothetical protein